MNLHKEMDLLLTKGRRLAGRRARLAAAYQHGLSEMPQCLIIFLPVGYKPEVESSLKLER